MPVAQTTTAITNATTQHVAPAVAKAPGAKRRRGSAKASPTRTITIRPPPSAWARKAADGQVCIGAGGKLTEPPTVGQTSGSARLDEAAVNLVKAGARYIQPGTEDGKPIDTCIEFRIRFQMTK